MEKDDFKRTDDRARLLTKLSAIGAVGSLILLASSLVLASTRGGDVLSLAAILCSFFNIFFRLSSIIIFKETFMPMDYESIKMLLEHLDFYALEAALGSCFYYWMIPVILLAVAAVALCCVVVWRDFGKKSRKTVKKWLNVFLVLFYLSLVSNLLFHIVQSMEYESYIQIRPLPFVSMELANNTIRELTEKKNFS